MRVVCVSIARPRAIEYRGRTINTGIFKTPVKGPVAVRRLNIEGDGQADLDDHGGIHQAVYAYPFEHYARWAEELGRTDLAPGQFGENLTLDGLTEESVRIGDVFEIGTARLEVSQPRDPCVKLAIKMGSPSFLTRFLASGRVGFYLRVIKEGELAAGDRIRCVRTDPDSLTVRRVSQLAHNETAATADARRAAELSALSPQWRRRFLEQLERRATV